MVRTHRLVGVGLLLMLISPPHVAAQVDQQIEFTSNAVRVAIGGRVQTLFTTTSVDEEPETLWEFRRVRMDFTVRVNDVVSGKVQPDFAGDRVSLKDTYLLLTFDPAFEVLAGKTYRPFGLLAQTSSTRILPIERGLRIRGLPGQVFDEYELVADLGYADRDIGLQVRGEPEGAPLGLEYGAGVFNGPVAGETGEEATTQFAARATIRPVELLKIGAGWSSREFVGVGLGGATPETDRGHAWEIDVEYGAFAPGLHLMAEITGGDFDPFADATFAGAQLWAAYRTVPLSPAIAHLEPTLRVSWGDPDRDAEIPAVGGTLLTPGLNIYFSRLNRVMLNYDVWSPDGDADNEASLKVMFQLAF